MFGKSLINKALAALAVVGAALCATPANAAILSVPGTYATIAAAYAAAAASGDTIELASGTYSEDNLLLGGPKTVTIKEAAGQTAIMNRRTNVTDGVVTIDGVDFIRDATSQAVSYGASGPGRFILQNMSVTDVAGAPAGTLFEATSTTSAGGFTCSNLTVTIDDYAASSSIYGGGSSVNNYTNCNFTFQGGGNAVYNINTADSTYTNCVFNGTVGAQYSQNDGGTQSFVGCTSNVTSNFFCYANGGNITVNGWTQASGALTYLCQVNAGRTLNVSGALVKTGGTIATPFVEVAGAAAQLNLSNLTFTAGFTRFQVEGGANVDITGTMELDATDFNPDFWLYMAGTGTTGRLHDVVLSGTSIPAFAMTGGDFEITGNITLASGATYNGTYMGYAYAAGAAINIHDVNYTSTGNSFGYTGAFSGGAVNVTGTIASAAGFNGGITFYTPGNGTVTVNNATVTGTYSQFTQADGANGVLNFTGTNSFTGTPYVSYYNTGISNFSGSIAISGVSYLADVNSGNVDVNLTGATVTGSTPGSVVRVNGTGTVTVDVDGSTISAASADTFALNNPNATLTFTNNSVISKSSGAGRLVSLDQGNMNATDSTFTIAPTHNRIMTVNNPLSNAVVTLTRCKFNSSTSSSADARGIQLASIGANPAVLNTINATNCSFISGTQNATVSSQYECAAIATNGGGTLDLRYNTFYSTLSTTGTMAIRCGGNTGSQDIVVHNNIFYVPAAAGGLRGAIGKIGTATYNVTGTKNLRYTGAAATHTNDALEGVGTIVSADPLLNADHIHLTNVSYAALGKGDGSITVANDIDGDPRPGAAHVDNTYDLGADQNVNVPVEVSEFSID